VSLTRHMVTIASGSAPRQVHYRRQGAGPAVLLLHQSPQSSREFEPLMQKWAENFSVIAPDTPGYGLSDPLAAADVAMEGLAEAVMEFADAIGLGRFGVYGYHTGGGMAVALAHAYPERITTAAVNGLVMSTPDELAAILANYLPEFVPAWDGSHLAWLWARLREQTIFFPWHDRRLAARMDFAVPAADTLQRHVREFLLAADDYAVAYRAAFSYAAGPVLPHLKVPALITAAALDPLAPHLERIADRSDCVKIDVSADGQVALDRAFEQLMAWPGDAPPPAPATRAIGERNWQDIVQVQRVPVRLARTGASVDVLSLHDAGGSALTAPALAGALGGVAAMDLPGHGECVPFLPAADRTLSIDGCANAVVAAAAALDVRPVLAGDGAGAIVALAAARQAPDRFPALLLTNLPAIDAELVETWQRDGLPSLAPDWHGGHLSRAWHMVRDGRLFFPWFRRERSAIRWVEPRLDPRPLQLEVREHLTADGSWQSLRRAQLASDPGGCPVPVIIAAGPKHPLRAPMMALASQARRSTFLSLDGPPARDSRALREAVALARAS
jgi:pimeloyl-ACP methyl ester carboxylesterase